MAMVLGSGERVKSGSGRTAASITWEGRPGLLVACKEALQKETTHFACDDLDLLANNYQQAKMTC
jgi:hypothetical protein